MLQYDKSAGVVHVDWFRPWKPNRFTPLWIWLSLTSQRFHTRMYWSHFIHHSKAIQWVINPLAYLAAGDSTAEHRGWRGHKHTHKHALTERHVHIFTHILLQRTHTHIFSQGSPWWPMCGKTLWSNRNWRHAPWPERPSAAQKSSSRLPEKEMKKKTTKKRKKGKKNWIQLHSRNPLLALREWYQHHLKVWLLTKPITFWLLGNGPVD